MIVYYRVALKGCAAMSRPVPAKYREMYSAGKSGREIAGLMGVCAKTVRIWRKSLGLPCLKQRQLTTEADDSRMSLYKQGLGDTHIAQRLGRHPRSIREWREQRGLAHPTKRSATRLPPIQLISLDYMIESGSSFHSIVADDKWSNWLEEMGATVW